VRDAVWVRRILAGDKAAGDRFVTAHYPRIYRMLRYLTDDAEAAEDLSQQTFVKAWQALDTFRNRSLLVTWLHRIAYHEYTHWLRSRREHAPLEAALDVPAPQPATEWATLLLPRALARLSDEHRETFLLYHVQELSVSEVATVLNLPEGTVKSRLFAARQHLRALLQEPAKAEEAMPPVVPAPEVTAGPKEGVRNELSSSQP
jgi:RNA polymerase sigma-70 factor (ECF subfamily)